MQGSIGGDVSHTQGFHPGLTLFAPSELWSKPRGFEQIGRLRIRSLVEFRDQDYGRPNFSGISKTPRAATGRNSLADDGQAAFDLNGL